MKIIELIIRIAELIISCKRNRKQIASVGQKW